MHIELEACYKLFGRNNREIDFMNSRLIGLRQSLQDLNKKYELSKKQNKAHIAATACLVETINQTSDSCDGCCAKVTDVPMPGPILSLEVAGASQALSEHMSPLPPTLPLGLVAPTAGVETDGPSKASSTKTKTVVYSDEMGVGMGCLLKNYLAQPVCNNSYSNMPFKEFLNKLKNSNFDLNTSLIIQLGNSLELKKCDIISLIETLLEIKSKGIKKIITCSFPYSNELSGMENNHIHKLNLILYNLTYRHSDFLYFETNNFIRKFILTKNTLYLSKNVKLTLAKLLAFNIHDPVISSISGHSDNAMASSVSSQAIGRLSTSVDLN